MYLNELNTMKIMKKITNKPTLYILSIALFFASCAKDESKIVEVYQLFKLLLKLLISTCCSNC